MAGRHSPVLVGSAVGPAVRRGVAVAFCHARWSPFAQSASACGCVDLTVFWRWSAGVVDADKRGPGPECDWRRMPRCCGLVWRSVYLLWDGQKSNVVPSRGSLSAPTRAGQSTLLMPQKRHSCALGTRVAGLSAAEPADQRTEALYELLVHGLRWYADRVVRVGDLPVDLGDLDHSGALGLRGRRRLHVPPEALLRHRCRLSRQPACAALL